MKVVAYTKSGKSLSLAGVAGIGGAGVALNCYKAGGVNQTKDADLVYCEVEGDVLETIQDMYSCPVVTTLKDLEMALSAPEEETEEE